MREKREKEKKSAARHMGVLWPNGWVPTFTSRGVLEAK